MLLLLLLLLTTLPEAVDSSLETPPPLDELGSEEEVGASPVIEACELSWTSRFVMVSVQEVEVVAIISNTFQ